MGLVAEHIGVMVAVALQQQGPGGLWLSQETAGAGGEKTWRLAAYWRMTLQQCLQ